MDYRVLGPLEVSADGRLVSLGGRRQRVLLALLLLHANQPVSRERLMDGLWPEDRPRSAANALEQYVSRVRKTLGEPVLATTSSGYVLNAARELVDASRFEALIAVTPRNEPARASEHLRGALGLWRGPAFCDLEQDPAAQAEIRRLGELRLIALEDCLEADLALGRARTLISELEALVEMYPLRERLRGQLMLALYRAGRQADSLAAYVQARQTLVDELGIEPERKLRDLHQAILQQDPALDLETPAETVIASEAPVPGRWPLPAALRSVSPTSYVGYESERALVEQTRVEVRDGARRVVLLAGEPGIGKTSLASCAALAAHGEGFAVVWASCSEELAVPYEPWIEVCSQLIEQVPEEVLAAHVEGHGGELVRLARGLARRVPGLPAPRASDPETERFLLFSAVAGLMRNVSRAAPVCLVLDDLHWADAQSVALFKHLVRSIDQGALQLIATYRDSDLGRHHPLRGVLADLRKVGGVQRIALRGLDVDEVAQVVVAAAGHELDQAGVALAGQIASETDGNPFFVWEILRSLTESGTLQFDETTGRWRIDRSAPLGLPEGVREVIERRVSRLGDEARELLAAAAVIGRSFELELLAALSELDEKRLLDQLEAAVAASLLEESLQRVGEFRFAHALINRALYEDLGPTRRARLHRRIAESLEAQLSRNPGDRVGELAHHWAKARTAVDLEKAVAYARMAGERALAALAPGEAVGWFDSALGLLGDREEPSLRCDLLIGLGEAQRLTGNAGYRETLLEASRISSELRDGERAACAALANSRGQPSDYGQVDQERVAAIERALDLDDDPERRAKLLSLQAIELVCEHDHRHRRELAQQAIALARELGDPRTTARVLNDYFFVFWAPDGLEQRLEQMDELRASVQAAGDPALEFWAANAEMNAMVEANELERAEQAAERMISVAERLGEPTMRWTARFAAGACMALLRGDLAEVERYAKQALQIGRDAGQPDAFFVYATPMSLVRLIQGHPIDVPVRQQSVRAAALMPGGWKAWGLASSLSWLGRGGEAAAILAEAAADRFEHVRWDQSRTSALALYADAAAQTGATEAAAILYELLEPSADLILWNGAATYGHVRMYLGLLAAALGWHELADQHFARACEIQERDGILMWAARTHLGWAEALAARGEPERAREQAARALELSRQHGYVLFERRAAVIVESRAPATVRGG